MIGTFPVFCLPLPYNGPMVTIRRARDEDAQAIHEVHTRAILEVCKTHYPAAHLEEWASRRTPDRYLPAIRSCEFFVAFDEVGIIGFAELDLGSGEVRAVYVHPRALRRGVGARLVGTLEELARAAGIFALHLKSTLNAVPFYQHAGFRILGPATHRISTEVEL